MQLRSLTQLYLYVGLTSKSDRVSFQNLEWNWYMLMDYAVRSNKKAPSRLLLPTRAKTEFNNGRNIEQISLKHLGFRTFGPLNFLDFERFPKIVLIYRGNLLCLLRPEYFKISSVLTQWNISIFIFKSLLWGNRSYNETYIKSLAHIKKPSLSRINSIVVYPCPKFLFRYFLLIRYPQDNRSVPRNQ